MQNEVISRVVSLIKKEDLSAQIMCSPENFAYVTGFVVPSQSLLRHRHCMAIVTRDAEVHLLGVDMEATTMSDNAPDKPLKIWAEFSDDPMNKLAERLREIGVNGANIGIELGYLPASDFSRLTQYLPDTKFVNNEKPIGTLRQIKTNEETALLRQLSLISDQAIFNAFENVKPGDTEMDLAANVTRGVYELGGTEFKLLIVATGERSQLPNVGPTNRKLTRGDVCRVEVFSVIKGYHAGVCRTAVVEKAPEKASEIWKTLIECKNFLLDNIKPGASCQELYQSSINILAKSGLAPISFLGHGIGLFLHENPYIGNTPKIGSNMDVNLAAGMVLGIEPLCYQTGYGYGMQNKDMILVTNSGCELLSNYTNTDKLIEIH